LELLPRWVLALLAARELVMLWLVRWGLRHGADIKVNWLGRLGVWPVLSALFFAMAGLETVGEILLYIGLALVLASTAKYVRDGLASRPSSTG
jgi:cardiolipin synthase (CMP-forming)